MPPGDPTGDCVRLLAESQANIVGPDAEPTSVAETSGIIDSAKPSTAASSIARSLIGNAVLSIGNPLIQAKRDAA